MTRRVWATGIAVVVASVVLGAVVPIGRESAPIAFPPARADHGDSPKPADAEGWREAAFARAKVWQAVDASRMDLAANPADPSGALSQPIVRCRFQPRPIRGTASKFDCVLPDGEVVKVKYGSRGEVRPELAASRLLTALGFGADRMYLVPRVRCYGCPLYPFQTMWVLERLGLQDFVSRRLPDSRYTDFEWVAVERHFEGIKVASSDDEGWSWFELDRIDPGAGANRAELDALRLMAMLLVHWDNKSANQRLVCVAPLDPATGQCPQPVAIIHDVGATFGPKRTNLERWTATGVWADASRCRVSMRQLPYGGGTFPDAEISEAGRALLARQLSTLDERRILALFTGARFSNPQAWTEAFQDKVRQIATAGPCPTP
jgi:hypothetical protein